MGVGEAHRAPDTANSIDHGAVGSKCGGGVGGRGRFDGARLCVRRCMRGGSRAGGGSEG